MAQGPSEAQSNATMDPNGTPAAQCSPRSSLHRAQAGADVPSLPARSCSTSLRLPSRVAVPEEAVISLSLSPLSTKARSRSQALGSLLAAGHATHLFRTTTMAAPSGRRKAVYSRAHFLHDLEATSPTRCEPSGMNLLQRQEQCCEHTEGTGSPKTELEQHRAQGHMPQSHCLPGLPGGCHDRLQEVQQCPT